MHSVVTVCVRRISLDLYVHPHLRIQESSKRDRRLSLGRAATTRFAQHRAEERRVFFQEGREKERKEERQAKSRGLWPSRTR